MSDLNEKMKSTTRRVSRWARRTGGLVSRWWEDVSALQARRTRIRELARERQQLLVEMGNKVYALHRRGKVQNRDLLADCSRIDRIGEDIARLQQEIEELRRKAAEEPGAIEVNDETPIVDDEDTDAATKIEVEDAPEIEDAPGGEGASGGEDTLVVEGASGVEDTPEVEKEATEPCAHAQTPAEGPAEENEGDDQRPECEQ